MAVRSSVCDAAAEHGGRAPSEVGDALLLRPADEDGLEGVRHVDGAPKGELFQLHSKKLVERGYKVMVLDLRDPYSSFRWNPLGEIYDRYQLYLNTGNEIYKHFEPISESDLELVNKPEEYGEEWYEYDGKAYAIRKQLLSTIKIARQKIYDELYEDLNDLIQQ